MRLRDLFGRKEIRHAEPYAGIWLLPRTEYDYASEVGDGLGSSVVMPPIQWIMRAFPEAPLAVIDADGSAISPHPMLDRLDSPNPGYGSDELWAATVWSYLSAGNAYWLKFRGTGNGVRELWFVPPWSMTPKWDTPTQYITHYEYSSGATIDRIPPEDVVHFRFGINPNNTRLGISPIAAVMRDIFTDDEAANWMASVVRNMGLMGGIISPDGNVAPSKADVEQVKAWFRQEFTGDRRGSVAVLGAPTKFTPTSFDPRNLELSAARNTAEERVCAALGLPAAVVGFGTGMEQTKVGATMRELRQLAWTGALIPMQRSLGRALTRQLLPDFDTRPRTVDFDRSQVAALQEDRNAKAERYARLVQAGIVTVADAQTALDLEPDPARDVYLMPIAAIEVPRRRSAKGRKGADDPTSAEAAAQQAPRVRPTRAQARLMAAYARMQRRLEAKMEGDLLPVFDRLGRMVADAAREVLAPKQGMDAEVTAERIMSLVAVQEIEGAMHEVWRGHYLRTATETVGALNDVMGLAIELPDAAAREIVAAGGRHLGLIDMAAQTRDRMFGELLDAQEAGEGVDVIVRRLREKIPAGPWSSPKVRAKVIARTETLHAQRTSQLFAYRAADVRQVVVFDARLGPTDAVCEGLDGRVVSIEEADVLGAEEHPNGTRSFAPVIGES